MIFVSKKYLIYARADFISEHEEIVAEWAGLGLSAVIIGLEAVTDPELDSMNKECSVDYNRRAISILRKYGVDTYGSLITQPDYTPLEWERLQRFIDENGLYYLNISPLTPLPGTVIWDMYKDKIVVDRDAHGLWDLSHTVLPTRMRLKDYYRSLLGVYVRSCLSISRASKLTLGTRPPVWSLKYLRLWLGAFQIMMQFRGAHRHHTSREIARAKDKGPAVAELTGFSSTPAAASETETIYQIAKSA